MACILILLLTTRVIAQQNYIHPVNKVLMKLYPRPFKMTYPDVPRITARQAFMLYKKNGAFFIRIGIEGGIVPGALYGKYIHKLNPYKLMRTIPKNQLVILYCNWNNEGSSARVAHDWIAKLKKHRYYQDAKRIRVVYGGWEEMRKIGFPDLRYWMCF